jgi:hypothetical protein
MRQLWPQLTIPRDTSPNYHALRFYRHIGFDTGESMQADGFALPLA